MQHLRDHEGKHAGEQCVNEHAAASDGGVGEDVAQLVADDGFELFFIQQVNDGAVELHAVEEVPAGQEFKAHGKGVDVFFRGKINGDALTGEAKALLHAADGGDERVAGVDAEFGIWADVLQSFPVGEVLGDDEIKQAEEGAGKKQEKLPTGDLMRLGHPPGDAAKDGEQFQAEPQHRARLVGLKALQQRLPRGCDETARLGQDALHAGQVMVCRKPRMSPREGRARVW